MLQCCMILGFSFFPFKSPGLFSTCLQHIPGKAVVLVFQSPIFDMDLNIADDAQDQFKKDIHNQNGID